MRKERMFGYQCHSLDMSLEARTQDLEIHSTECAEDAEHMEAPNIDLDRQEDIGRNMTFVDLVQEGDIGLVDPGPAAEDIVPLEDTGADGLGHLGGSIVLDPSDSVHLTLCNVSREFQALATPENCDVLSYYARLRTAHRPCDQTTLSGLVMGE